MPAFISAVELTPNNPEGMGTELECTYAL